MGYPSEMHFKHKSWMARSPISYFAVVESFQIFLQGKVIHRFHNKWITETDIMDERESL